jgi:tetratricopeptide (TPR) repeat protein
MKFMRGIWRFTRSILKAVLVMLPISIIVTIYMGRDMMTVDGIRLLWESWNLEKPSEVVLPDDWGHGTIPHPNPNIAQIAVLLRAGDRAGLETLYQRDPDAFARFADSSPDLEVPLDALATAAPNSALPLVLRGNHWFRRGLHRRGNAYSRNTAQSQFTDMRTAFTLAEVNFLTAIHFDPTTDIAYRQLLHIYRSAYRDIDKFPLWQRGIDAGAGTTELYRELFNSILPWFGWLSPEESVATMREVIALIDSGQLEGTVDVELLRNFPDWVEAESLWSDGSRAEALAKYATFVDGPGGRYFLDNYAEKLALSGRIPEGLEYFVSALHFDPSDLRALDGYGSQLVRIERYDEARDILDRMLQLDPYNPDILLQSTALEMNHGDVSTARTNFEQSQVYGAERAAKSANRGLLTARDHKDLPTAITYYRRAIEINVQDRASYFKLGQALDESQDCGAIPAYRNYVALCDQGQSCGEYPLRWARVRWKLFVNRQICSIDGYRLDHSIWLRIRPR